MNYEVVDHENDVSRVYEDKEDALRKSIDMKDSSDNVEIIETEKEPECEPEPEPEEEPADIVSGDGGEQMAQPVEQSNGQEPEPEQSDSNEESEVVDTAMESLGQSVQHDPLEILPDYMIETVKGTPTLNKRGLSVLAYHYGIDTTDRERVVTPAESDWEYAIVETTVTNDDGKTFVGTGTAHVDRGDDKTVLLELAETRSYKRAVSFATGVGIVSYQEMVGELNE